MLEYLTIKDGVITKCKKDIVGEVIIPKGVTQIGDEAFYECTGLTSVEIPSSVTEIGGATFENCTGLTSVEIPPSVTKIRYDAFKGCNITTLNHPCLQIINGVAIKYNVLLYCATQSSHIVIPQGVIKIGEAAFYGCKGLTSVEIPSSVTEIDDMAFYGCTSLTSVEIPSSVTVIGDDAFVDCDNLDDATRTRIREIEDM